MYRCTVEKERPALWTLQIEEQANHGDQICASNINNEEFLMQQLKSSEVDHESFKVWNDTSIGNAACIALYGPTDELKDGFRHILDEYIVWRRENSPSPYSEFGGPLSECVMIPSALSS